MLQIHRFITKVNQPVLMTGLTALALAGLACGAATGAVPTELAATVAATVTPQDQSQAATVPPLPPATAAPAEKGSGALALDARGELSLEKYAFDLYGSGYPTGIGPELFCLGTQNPPGGLYWTFSYDGRDISITEGAPLFGIVEEYRLASMGWCACGLAQEVATANLTAPDGSVTPLETRVPGGPPIEGDLCGSFEYTYDLDSPPGTYTVAMESGGQTLTDTFNLSLPDSLSGLWVYPKSEVWFGGLQPGESLTATVFATGYPRFNADLSAAFVTYGLADQQPATADARGLLRIAVQRDDASGYGLVAAVEGGQSGKVFACQTEGCGSGVQLDDYRALLEEYLFLRPDQASLPLLSNFRFCEGSCDSNPPLTQFPAGAQAIHVAWDYANFQAGTPYTREWSANGSNWLYYPNCKWNGPTSGTQEIVLREPGGLRSGQWVMTITSNHVVLAQVAVEVAEGHDFWEPAGVIEQCPD